MRARREFGALAPGRFPELRPFLRKGLAHYGRLRYRSALHAGSGPSSRVLKIEFADRQEQEVIIIDYEHTLAGKCWRENARNVVFQISMKFANCPNFDNRFCWSKLVLIVTI